MLLEGTMINICCISKHYDNEVIHDFSYTFFDHNKYLLHGKSGIGKTTLLRLITNLEKVDEGSINVEGRISYSPQSCALLDSYNSIKNIKIYHSIQINYISISRLMVLIRQAISQRWVNVL